ncbi:integrator complex subunit [Striga asiatica]|uniref:Integrator complex subunit n=1 Tax=Striga asiatica TaxID=4170 RepID=A0A5A7RDF1_STRAF|nr:integrator complex subunit [Striga asiatica]
MEDRLLSAVIPTLDQYRNLSPESAAAVISLVTNPFTSDRTLSSLIETLSLHLQNPDSNHRQLLSLLSAISRHQPRLRHLISAAVHAFIVLPSTPTPSIPHALSLVDPTCSPQPDPFADESLFLSLCFWPCVKIRGWMLRNASKFLVRPSALLTVLLGLTKDPYPNIRGLALDGLTVLSGGIVVEDRHLVEGCYFRAVELLFDSDNYVRHSAVCAVSEWGQLLVGLCSDETKMDRSDALFLQLCLMVRDTDSEIRVAAFNALGKVQTVSEDILLQTLSKKPLLATKEKNYLGQYTAKIFKIQATAAAYTFVHGLEDEFYQVRRSACHALQVPVVLSAKFAAGAVHILMDMLIDDSDIVRLQALETLHHMAIHEHLKVEESHLHMFLGALVDSSTLIRSAARKTLQLSKLQKLAMFRSCTDSLIKNLELYPQVCFSSKILFSLDRVCVQMLPLSRESSAVQILEPSFEGKLVFHKLRTAALLALAISAPISLERQVCSIPPQFFSYAVTLLGRLSHALVGVMDQNALLSYLTYCSKFTVASASENSGDEEAPNLNLEDSLISFPKESDKKIPSFFPKSLELNSKLKTSTYVEIVLKKVGDLWPLIRLGCMNEVVQILRNLKKELRVFVFPDVSSKPSGILVFALRYLHVVKLLGKAWTSLFSQRNPRFKGMGLILMPLLCKMERLLEEMLYRFHGLSREGKLHIFELMLLTCVVKFSHGGTFCFEGYTKKLNFVLSRVEDLLKEESSSMELSSFVDELRKISSEIRKSENGPMSINELDLFEKSLHLFSLKCVILPEELEYYEAEVEVHGNNSFENPFPFITGLPVGLPLDITLYNISRETRLWVVISLGERSSQFVFLDLPELGAKKRFTFIAPFYRTPKVKHLVLRVSIAMECFLEDQYSKKQCNNGPKHELVYLCKEREVHLSMAVK